MNISRYDLINSLKFYNPTYFFTEVVILTCISPFYAGWIVYSLSEVSYLKMKIRALNHRSLSLETTQLLYKYRGDLYKWILMFLIALVEFLYFFTIMLTTYSTDPNLSIDKFEYISQLTNDTSTCSYIFALIFLFLINILTKHLINVCKSNYRIQLLPPIQHRLIILTLVLMLMAIVKLAIDTFDNLIIEMVGALLLNYEHVSLYKNSKQLYYVLKWRYEDMRYEYDYPQTLYKAHKRMAQKYKYLTAFILFDIFFLSIAGWCHIPIILFTTIFLFRYPPHLLMPAVLPLRIINGILIVSTSIGATQMFLLVGVSLYYLAAVCWNKTVTYGRNRIYYVKEPILQNSHFC